MNKAETLQDFYESSQEHLPVNIRQHIGHFNLFKLDPYVGKDAQPAPYRRRDYYKIMLVEGNGKFVYADKEIEVNQHALVFSNPQIPYSWEQRDRITSGCFCIFDQNFFHQHGNINQYPLFQPDGNHVFELTDEQASQIKTRFEQMFTEIDSDYAFKYDVLRTNVQELIHFALKMNPSEVNPKAHSNAAQRISGLFMELLDRQFPIDDVHQTVQLRSPSEYAERLNVHVNHLNRAVKEVTQKTTSQLIAERVLQESKVLLKQTPWTVSEIAYTLGFNELTHFNNFFKKHQQLSPLKFRHV